MSVQLEHFVNNVQTLSGQGNWRELCDYLSKSSEVLLRNAAHLDTVLETLDVQQHSLGVLAILCVKFALLQQSPVVVGQGQNATDFEALFLLFTDFIDSCNGEQIRYASDTLAEVCHSLRQSLIDRNVAIRGIAVLQKAIRKVRISDTQLTSLHADLCQLCLVSKCLQPALEFLDIDITEISQENGHFDSKPFLLYYYYGGLIYAGLKQWERALYYFEVAVATPALAVSHIMLEAYKHYILVSLILHGRIMPLPKYTSQVIVRFIRPLSQVYHDIASAFTTNNPAQLATVVNKHQDMINRDHNMGLVKQVQASLYKKTIQRLTQTFLTLSLADMAHRVQLPNVQAAEKLVLDMIEEGEIYATIHQKDGMVVFHDSPNHFDSPSTLQRLGKYVSLCMELDKQIQKMEEEILVNPQYVKKASGAQDEDLPASAGNMAAGSSKMPTFAM
nr:EOG090X04TU [Lepidurus arcticus]